MTEEEYIRATNLQKFRIISDLLRDCLPSKGLPESQLNDMLAEAVTVRDNLFKMINVDVR